MELGIACASGSYKGVFVQGVLDSFEEAGRRADIYAAASSSAVCAAYAAVGRARQLGGAASWGRMWSAYVTTGYDISAAVLDGVREMFPAIQDLLFQPGSARLAIAASEVVSKEAAEITQGPGARRLGQQLVLATRAHDNSWAVSNLAFALFDTRATDPRLRLTRENLAEVAYATTRMLHAWKTPAWIDGRPFVDASYTCSCPAAQLAEMGCRQVVAIAPESGPVYTDFFQASRLPELHRGIRIRVIQPDRNLSEIGVDYLKATEEGLAAGYAVGRAAGEAFLARGGLDRH